MRSEVLFKTALLGSICLCTSKPAAEADNENNKRPNIMLIVADDLNCSTTPMFGCQVPNLMPNIERLSQEGMLFRQAHVVSGASQVSRGGIMTGLYPHTSGIDGFYHTEREDIPTLQEIFRASGYKIGIISKVEHSSPKRSTEWDMAVQEQNGRNPQLYFNRVTEFIKRCQDEDMPFFFMANSEDPHRPFAGSEHESKIWPNRRFPDPERMFTTSEVTVPGFLPDDPEIRREIAQYYSSVKRLDQTVGAVLQALKDTGEADNTIVFFLSDNGMSMPFAKTCSYLHSTHTPLIVKYPGVTSPGSEDDTHFVNGIDFLPTVLEIAGIARPSGLQGRSFYPLLKGKRQFGRKYVYTEFTENSGKKREPIRAVQNSKYGYIYNVWSDGERAFRSETTSGITFSRMIELGQTDKNIAERVKFYENRVPEEFYDYEKDPNALNNLINDPEYKRVIKKFRNLLAKHMRKTGDPVLEPFLHREDPEAAADYMHKQDDLVQQRVERSFYSIFTKLLNWKKG